MAVVASGSAGAVVGVRVGGGSSITIDSGAVYTASPTTLRARSIVATDGDVITMRHETQGGQFRYDAGSSEADDGGTIFVDARGQRWKRVYYDTIHAAWFGPANDGVTNDSAVLNAFFTTALAARDSAGNRPTIRTQGSYGMSAPLSINTTVSESLNWDGGAGNLDGTRLIELSSFTGDQMVLINGQSGLDAIMFCNIRNVQIIGLASSALSAGWDIGEAGVEITGQRFNVLEGCTSVNAPRAVRYRAARKWLFNNCYFDAKGSVSPNICISAETVSGKFTGDLIIANTDLDPLEGSGQALYISATHAASGGAEINGIMVTPGSSLYRAAETLRINATSASLVGNIQIGPGVNIDGPTGGRVKVTATGGSTVERIKINGIYFTSANDTEPCFDFSNSGSTIKAVQIGGCTMNNFAAGSAFTGVTGLTLDGNLWMECSDSIAHVTLTTCDGVTVNDQFIETNTGYSAPYAVKIASDCTNLGDIKVGGTASAVTVGYVLDGTANDGTVIKDVQGNFAATLLPYQWAGPFGASNWSVAKRDFTYSADTAAFARATSAFVRSVVGSGTNGPAYSDCAAFFSSEKASANSSNIQGELDGIIVSVKQGRKGDAAGALFNVSKVFGTGTDSEGALAWEASTVKTDTATPANTTALVQTAAGFMEGAGGVSSTSYYGFWTEATVATGFAGVYVGGNGASWSYIHYHQTSRGAGAADLTLSNYYVTGAGTMFNRGPHFFVPGSSVTPTINSSVAFELTSNTVLTAKAKGADGTVRSSQLQLGGEISYTPTVTAGAGTITTQANKIGNYTQVGKRIRVDVQITITTVGTATQSVNFTLPANSKASRYFVGSAFIANTNVGLVAYVLDNVLYVTALAGTFPVIDGQTIEASVEYEAA